MTKFKFIDADDLLSGIVEIAKYFPFTVADDGIAVTAHKCDAPTLRATLDESGAHIYYAEKCQFYRALGLLLEQIDGGATSLDITENPQFRMNGVMFDMSQGNCAFTPKAMEGIMCRMAVMGLNMLMLYCEDNYEVKEQPYFGYMRPTYSQDDMRRMDDYAYELGIEMIPCIQTLAHMPDALRWDVFYSIRDYEECLLVGEEKTYKFIDDLIRNASAPFRTKKIHIGMDEAWKLGKGQYLEKHGLCDPSELMREHLGRVMEIIRKYDLEPMMWDDMFFRVFGDGNYRQTATPVPEHVKSMVPPEMGCVYWDYSSSSDARFERQLELSDKIIFAGGSWAFLGYGFACDYTLRTSNDALALCRKYGIRDVFMTTWGDNGTEVSQRVNMIGAQLFAENGYSDSMVDEETLRRRFKFCCGGELDDFRLMQDIDRTPNAVGIEGERWLSASKYLMWQDILTGLADKNIEGVDIAGHYTALAEKLHAAVGRNGEFDAMFRMSALAADVIALKGDMGLRLTAAYREGDKDTLRLIAEVDLPELTRRVNLLRDEHYSLWMADYKPLGWDIVDLRYGGLLARIDSAKRAVTAYLDGKLERIDELEVERLYYNGSKGPLPYQRYYGAFVSPSRIDPRA